MLAVSQGHLYVGLHPSLHSRKIHLLRNKGSARAKSSGLVWVQITARQVAQPQTSLAPVETTNSWPPVNLKDVQVILASPKAAANVGSVARAAANFEVVCLCVCLVEYYTYSSACLHMSKLLQGLPPVDS
ncbi:hypothetical protein ABBQ32_011149 [Trebouxia sp. C0010 RCD-2024]